MIPFLPPFTNRKSYHLLAYQLVFVCLGFACLFAQSSPNIPQIHTLIGQYQLLKSNQFSGPVYRLEQSIRLTFPDLTVELASGHLRFLQGADPADAGFVFIGRGAAHFAPRHRVERKQMTRFTDGEELQAEFDYFAVKSVAGFDFRTHLAETGALKNFDEAASRFVGGAEADLLERLGFNLPARLLTDLVLDPTGFTACIFRDVAERPVYPPVYYYLYDPVSHEQVQLLQYRPKSLGKPFYTLCRYPLGDYLTPQSQSRIRIAQYNGWVEISKNGEITADIGVDILTGSRKLQLLYFQLSKLLDLQWATTVDGDSLFFIREKEQTGFSLFLPEQLTPVDTLRINFHYSGKILTTENGRSMHLKDPTQWHPRLGYLQRGRYKLIYKYPRDLDLVANGELLREWQEGEHKLSYYFQRVPAKASMFLLGAFKRSHFF